MRDYIAEAKALEPWYHAIKFSDSYTTPSFMPVYDQWNSNRKVRSLIPYAGKSVLDLGTMDGMWAFEAEKLGARIVVAADIWQNHLPGLNRFMLAHQALESKAIPVTNAEVHVLHSRMVALMNKLGIGGGFDVIQCLGLIYHIQNPMLAFHQIRKCLAHDGVMLLETSCWNSDDQPIMRFNCDLGAYNDTCSFWFPNLPCLVGMLENVRI